MQGREANIRILYSHSALGACFLFTKFGWYSTHVEIIAKLEKYRGLASPGSVLLAPNSKYVIKIVLLLLQCSAMFLCYFVCVMFFTSFVVIFVVCLPFGRAQAAETTVKLE